MADITVNEVGNDTFEVVVAEGSSSTTHRVTVGSEDLDAIRGEASAADVVEASFHFLLDREPKESILRDFELGVISRYFPDYRDKIDTYL